VEAADIVVVGAGIIGSSIAYQLARRTSEKVVVLDKGDGPSEGSTGASSAIIRTFYTQPDLVKLALDAQEAYRHWSDFTGLAEPASHYARTGVLWILGFTAASARTVVERLTSQGVRASVLGSTDVHDRFPSVSTCDVPFDLTGETGHECVDLEAAVYEHDGGYADPTGANRDLIDAARREGASVRFRSPVVGVGTDGSKVTGVETADGSRIDTRLVINASGPWCNRLDALAGVDTGWSLTPTRVQVVYRSIGGLGRLPVVADHDIYLRQHGTQILFGSVLPEDEREIADPDTFLTSADAAFKDIKIHALHHRILGLPHRGTVGGIAGLYTINHRDFHPILGPTALDGWWVANGFSGHGFKLAPMIGSLIAQATTGSRAPYDTDVPLSFLGVDRGPLPTGHPGVLA
jgi:glycine/D-amino acid oxidase-like deaminating enzyme